VIPNQFRALMCNWQGKMSGDDVDFSKLPSDPTEAFLFLERRFRDVMNEKFEPHEHYDPTPDRADYVGRVMATKDQLGLNILEQWNDAYYADVAEKSFKRFLGEVTYLGHATRFRAPCERMPIPSDSIQKLRIKSEII
jgi:hypothetical protein